MDSSQVLSSIAMRTHEVRTLLFSRAPKRAFDIVASLLGLIFLLPFFCLIAIAIQRETPGPVLYRGRRVGRGGKEFWILKFRTMYELPESYSGAKVTASDDPRITPLGHWLRNTKFNELPQLWNVFIGEMSLVGPRPEDPDIARAWPPDIFQEVLSVRPGITSPASIVYRNEEALLCADNLLKKYLEEVSPDKQRLDQLYVRYRSFVLDLDVLFWTFIVMIPKLHPFSPPETLLFVGPFTRLIRRYVSWFIIDTFIMIFAFLFLGLILHSYSPLSLGLAKDMALILGFALLFATMEAVLGVNDISWSKATITDLYDLIIAWFISTIITVLATLQLHVFTTRLVLGVSLLALFCFIVVRYRTRLTIELVNWILSYQSTARAPYERVLIIGSNQAGQHAAWLLTHPANARKFRVMGFVDNEIYRQGMRLYGIKVIGTVKNIPALLKKYRISLVLLVNHKEFMDDFKTISATCKQSAAKLVVLPDILATLSGLAEHAKPTAPVHNSQLMVPLTGSGKMEAHDCETNPCLSCLLYNDTYQYEIVLKHISAKIKAGDFDGACAFIKRMQEGR